MCFAPSGSGKGVGIVIPNLLHWPDSAIVHDVKGENFRLTCGFRAARGQKVYFFNPGDPEGRTHRYNPFQFVSNNPGLRIDDLQKIAHLLLPKHDFWENEARTLWSAWRCICWIDPNVAGHLRQHPLPNPRDQLLRLCRGPPDAPPRRNEPRGLHGVERLSFRRPKKKKAASFHLEFGPGALGQSLDRRRHLRQ